MEKESIDSEKRQEKAMRRHKVSNASFFESIDERDESSCVFPVLRWVEHNTIKAYIVQSVL